MSDTPQNEAHPPVPGTPADASPEELEAAQAANEADAQSHSQAEFAALQAKNTELIEQYMRAQADMQNTRRRAEEEIAKARKFAVESFAESLLPVADSLEAGLAIKEAGTDVVRAGAEATLRQLTSALERNKVSAINPPAGTKFDPHQHQAISVVAADQEANTVVSVLQKGYSIADRILRPALVTVTAPK